MTDKAAGVLFVDAAGRGRSMCSGVLWNAAPVGRSKSAACRQASSG